MNKGTRRGDWIQLRSGEPFWPLDPRADEIQLEDIAGALGMLCRFGGHVKRFYSVAEHSVAVSRMVPSEFALWGLLHDATEAYLVDLPRPIKNFMQDYKRYETNLERIVAERFGLLWPIPIEVRQADMLILSVERDQLLHPSRLAWEYPQVDTMAGQDTTLGTLELEGWCPEKARLEFLKRFDQIMERLS